MRVISGKYKGRVIKMPKEIRPSQDKVRKALFDILGGIEGLSFLELFAGSGAIGIEALSQGVKELVLVEKDPECIKIIKDNFSLLGEAGYSLIGLDTQQALARLSKEGRKFDIIFMDPPYYQDMAKKTLQTLAAYDILTPSGFILVQHFKKDFLPEKSGDFTLFKQYKYGDTLLSLYQKVTSNQ
ncbi:MAG: 16S rRNA (guanine(966)-N(2))-methyltransferase RsmD [Candidatus Omnitrophota bacterium]|nr:16S rRNA (guanine(966)-N(2))-methyltransferase RsmD [Candidatus Omnitrophota bacterium]